MQQFVDLNLISETFTWKTLISYLESNIIAQSSNNHRPFLHPHWILRFWACWGIQQKEVLLKSLKDQKFKREDLSSKETLVSDYLLPKVHARTISLLEMVESMSISHDNVTVVSFRGELSNCVTVITYS